MKKLVRRALVLAHEAEGPAGHIEVRLLERGFEVDTHVITHDYDAPNVSTSWPDLSAYDLVVPMGSIRSLTRKEEIDKWVHEEIELLAKAHAAGQPILGVCFGAQLMADALGGSVEKSPEIELGWMELDLAANAPIGPGPWMVWHHDRVNPPPEAEVLATTDLAVQMFRLDRTVCTQFHPEVDTAHITRWLEAAGRYYLEEFGVERDYILSQAAAHEEANIKQCHALVDWFLDDVAFSA